MMVGSVIAVVAVLNSRRGKQGHGFTVKPAWAEGVLIDDDFAAHERVENETRDEEG